MDLRAAFLQWYPDLEGSEGPLPRTDAGRYYIPVRPVRAGLHLLKEPG